MNLKPQGKAGNLSEEGKGKREKREEVVEGLGRFLVVIIFLFLTCSRQSPKTPTIMRKRQTRKEREGASPLPFFGRKEKVQPVKIINKIADNYKKENKKSGNPKSFRKEKASAVNKTGETKKLSIYKKKRKRERERRERAAPICRYCTVNLNARGNHVFAFRRHPLAVNTLWPGGGG
jgi:hypothetical protein